MPKISNIAPHDCIQALKKFGFSEIAGGKGSHVKMVRGDVTIVVPTSHNPIKVGTLTGILKSAGISKAEFLKAI